VLNSIIQGPSWSCLYGCWIYNYLCNQCLSLLKLWVQIPLRRGITEILLKVALNTITLILSYSNDKISSCSHIWPKENICVFTVTCQKKSRVGRSGLIFFFFFFLLSAKPEIVVPESDSVISFSKFLVKWRNMQFFYLLCSQFRQKASSWINKTLLLVKQQNWLSEFCVKIHRVASKN
jgi:hypothetical protein